MHKIPFYILLLFFTATLINGCRRSGTTELEQADMISYQVIYLEDMAGDIPTRMLPDVMKAYYTNRYIKTSINGFFGQFSLVQVADLRKNKVTTMLNFFGTMVFSQGERGEIPAGILPLKNPKVTYTKDTMYINGILSKRAEITTSSNQYDIYYTEEFDIKSPNITTPYNFIDHPLSDFRVELSILKMHLVLKNHEKIEIDHSVFEVPDDYEQVSRKTMESLINSLFTKE